MSKPSDRLNDDQVKQAFQSLISGAIGLVILIFILLIGLTVVGGIGTDLGGLTNKTVSPDPITGSAVNFQDTSNSEVEQVFSVRDSTGYAVKFTGSNDSYLQSKQKISVAENNNWSVSTWARVDSGAASKNMTALSVNGRLLIQYNGSRGNWSVWYYDDGSRNSYRVDVNAPNQPGNLTYIEAWNNGTHLAIYRNTTQGQIVNISGSSNVEDAEINNTNFDGTIEETRGFDNELNSTERSNVINNPVAPRPGLNRTIRVTYDEGKRTTTNIYFTSTSASLSNFSWVKTGHPGNELVEGTDYEISLSDGTITALTNGKIDGAPVVWIDYEFGQLSFLLDIIGTAFKVFASASIIIPFVVIVFVLISVFTDIGSKIEQHRPRNRR